MGLDDKRARKAKRRQANRVGDITQGQRVTLTSNTVRHPQVFALLTGRKG